MKTWTMKRMGRYWIGLVLALSLILPMRPAAAQQGAGVIRVAPSGEDVEGCGSEALPCQNIQNAVNLAVSGDTILVARGVYTFNDAYDVCTGRILGTTAAVCFFDKELTILGGYATNNWRTADPAANLTVIDGEGRWRGVRLLRTPPPHSMPASLVMQGFTIRNGLAQGRANAPMEYSYTYGGGLFSEWAPVTLRHMSFRNNRAVGGDLSGGAESVPGAGAGGAIAVNAVPAVILEHITMDGNEARGGQGLVRGGFALGGGLFTYSAVVNAAYLTVTNNTALAGSAPGAGRDAAGATADALGGGISIEAYSTATLSHIYMAANRVTGGAAPNGEAGGAYGGGLATELAQVLLLDAQFLSNTAQGGAGKNTTKSAAIGEGGGLQATNADITIERSTFLHNAALGGAGTIFGGPAGGGGAAVMVLDRVRKTRIANSVFADNLAAVGAGDWVGGGSGALWLQGVIADVTHCTFAANRLGAPRMQGQAITVIGGWVGTTPIQTSANISYSIFADHLNDSNQATLHVQGEPGGLKQIANLTRGLWANNTRKTNLADGGWAGAINGLGTMLSSASAGFLAPAAPHYDYRIANDSPARNEAAASTLATDIEGQLRVGQGPADIGADEFSAFQVGVRLAQRGALKLGWTVNPSLEGKLTEQYIRLQCPAGVDCPDDIGPLAPQVTAYTIMGLPSGAYQVQLEGRSQSGDLVEHSNQISITPIFLPALLHQ